MYPGDLVVTKNGAINLYNEEILDEIHEVNRYTTIFFEEGETGLILEVFSVDVEDGWVNKTGEPDQELICKILVPGGIGYTFERWLKRVNEPR
jgi:hypothetical protein